MASSKPTQVVMQQTMLRIKEPKRSLDFYVNCLGMTLIEHIEFPKYKFSLYFVGYLPKGMTVSDLPPIGERHTFSKMLPGLIELTHNHGSETKEGNVYHTGNSYDGVEGGFGHIGITVPDVYEACDRFKSMGVGFKKSPNSGGMKGLAFVYDPDGYAIEVIHQGPSSVTKDMDCCGFSADGTSVGELCVATPEPSYSSVGEGGALMDVSRYYMTEEAQPRFPPTETHNFVMQQTMIRVKEVARSLDFYTRILGMTLVQEFQFPQWGFSLFFVAYIPEGFVLPGENGSPERLEYLWSLPATIELTHNHGSETKEGSVYHTGNSYDGVEGGFGHIGITVPDVYEACDRFKSLGVEFKKSPNSGGMKGLAFIKDPDGYWIEVIKQGERGELRQVDCCGVDLDNGGVYTGGGSTSK